MSARRRMNNTNVNVSAYVHEALKIVKQRQNLRSFDDAIDYVLNVYDSGIMEAAIQIIDLEKQVIKIRKGKQNEGILVG